MKTRASSRRRFAIFGAALLACIAFYLWRNLVIVSPAVQRSIASALDRAASARLILVRPPDSSTTQYESLQEVSAVIDKSVEDTDLENLKAIIRKEGAFGLRRSVDHKFAPHHAIELKFPDESTYCIFISFDSDQIQPETHEAVECPQAWLEPLRNLFINSGFPLNTNLINSWTLNAGIGEADLRGPFAFDRDQPFKIDLGRGSGLHGLDTVSLSDNGTVLFYRHERSEPWKTASLTLSVDQISELGRMVERYGLPELNKQYRSPGIYDGTQWIFCLRQGKRRKSAYFDNNFPKEIRDFANELDHVLKAAGYDSLNWQKTDEKDPDERVWELAQ